MSGRPRLGDLFSNRQEPGRPGLPVMSVTMNDSLVLRDDLDRRTESALRPDQHLLVRTGDIAYNMMRMWQGACGLATADGVVSPAYVVLAPKPGIDSRFAYHWFKSARMIHLFWAYSHGLTEDRLRLYFDEFSRIPAVPPSLEQQLHIVSVADTWDKAIDLNRRLVANLRRKRAALMRTLFGTECLSSNGQLPAGWSSACVGELCEFANVLWVGNEPPFTNIGVIRNTNFTEDGTLDATDIATLDVEERQLTSRRLEVGDIILEKSGGGPDQPVGRVALFDWRDGIYSFSNFTSSLRIIDRRRIEYRYLHSFLLWVYLSGLTEVMQTRSTGIRNLDSSEYKKIRVPLPPIKTQRAISDILNAEQSLIAARIEYESALVNQKRGLIQKLLTGSLPPDESLDPNIPALRLAFIGGAT